MDSLEYTTVQRQAQRLHLAINTGPGKARQGKARQGKARQGKARQGIFIGSGLLNTGNFSQTNKHAGNRGP